MPPYERLDCPQLPGPPLHFGDLPLPALLPDGQSPGGRRGNMRMMISDSKLNLCLNIIHQCCLKIKYHRSQTTPGKWWM